MPPKTPKIKDSLAGAEDGDESSISPSVTSQDPTPEAEPKPAPTPSKRVSKKRAPAAKLVAPVYNTLPSNLGDTAPVDVSYGNNGVQSIEDIGSHGQSQMVKLAASRPFSLITSVMLEDGPYAGDFALVIRPSKPFPFLRLPKHIRTKIYHHVLFPEDEDDKHKIVISSRAANKGGGVMAKSYIGQTKNRLSLLHVNKEITAEARPVLYSFNFKFDNTNNLLIFLTSVGEPIRSLMNSIEIALYQKSAARPAFDMLSECKSLMRLHIGTGVALKTTPSKAATAFFADAGRFLETMGSSRGRKGAGMEILRFGKSASCFSIKEGGDEPRAWDAEEKEEFQELLRAKLV